ncbi:InlB B-repeat-containing protein [[Clostridium] innocuum]|nr:InlB B-repeat-containing protein [[Clostridium] innocuum]
MKKRFGKLLLAIVMTLQLVPSSMTTIAANDSVAYKDDFVQVTMENKPTAAYETGSSEIPDGVSKLNVEVHVDGALKASRTLTFGSATNPEKTEITANAGYAVEQVTLNGEAFDNSIVYNREVGESEKNLVINVYTKAAVTIHYQDLEGNKLAEDDVKEGKLHEKLTLDAKAIDGYTASKDNASDIVLENTGNEITLVYSKQEKAVSKAPVTKKAKATNPGTCSVDVSRNCFMDDGTYVDTDGTKYPTEYTVQTGSGKIFHESNQVGKDGKLCADGKVGNLQRDVLPYRHYVILKDSTDINVITYIRCDVYQSMINPPTPEKETYKVTFMTSENSHDLGAVYVNKGEKINRSDVPDISAKRFYDDLNKDYIWVKEKNSNTEIDFSTIIVNSTMTIYAKGIDRAVEKFTVNFDLAGGTYNDKKDDVKLEIESGKKISESAIPTPVLKDNAFKGWKSGKGQKVYSNEEIADMIIRKNMNFTAVYEKETFTREAEYFVLLPSSELPKNLSGNYNPSNFVPSNSNTWNGPTWGGNNDVHNQGMGFSGYISEDAFQKAYIDKTPITDENGVDSKYIFIPDGHIPEEYTVKSGADKGKTMKLDNIVWYSIKKQDKDRPHVDGYIKKVSVEIGYYPNIDNFDPVLIENAVTGNEYTVKDHTDINDFPKRKGYEFNGWNTRANGKGTSYAAGDEFTVKTSVALYAQWKKDDKATKDLSYTIEHWLEGSKEAEETVSMTQEIWVNDDSYPVDSIKSNTYEGYEFKHYEFKDKVSSLPITVKDKDTIKVIYEKTNQKYTVRHIDEDSNEILKSDEGKDAKFNDRIIGENCKTSIDNYTFTKADNLTVGTDNEKNIVKVYYSKDRNKDGVPDKYQIEVTYTAENGTIDSDHANGKKFYVTLLKDGKWATKEDGGIGHLSDNQIATATAARGYSQDSLKWAPKVPTTKLDLNEDTQFVADFEKDSFRYSIEYYYDGVKGKTDSYTAMFEEEITWKPEVSVMYEGRAYALDKVENNPLSIGTEESKNVIRLYYGTDENKDQIPDKYQIKVIYKAVNGTIDSEHANIIGNKTFYVTLLKDGKWATKEDGGIGYLSDNQIATATAAKGYSQDSLSWSPETPTTKLPLNTETEFVAKFEEDAKVTISYKSNDENMGTVTNAKDEVKPLTGTVKGSKAEAKEGYAFKNWTNAEGTIVSWDDEFKPAKVDGLNVAGEYTANFGTDENGDKIPDEYQVKYTYQAAADQKGTVSGTTVEWINKYKVENGKLVIENNKPVAIDAHPTQPSTVKADKGYHFQKWNDGTNDFATDEALRKAKYEEDTTFSAYFEEDAEITISYKSNDENMGTVTNAKDEVKPVTGTVKGSKAEASEGYAFKNWTNAEGTIVSWDEEFKPAKVDGLNVAGEYTANFGTDENGDKIPDEYQVKYTYQAAADQKGTVSGTTVEWINKYEVENGKLVIENNKPVAIDAHPTQPSTVKADKGYHFQKWNDGTNDFATDEALRKAKYEEDTTFSAYFEEDAEITISYKSNDENMGTVTNAKDEVKPVTGTVKGSKAEASEGYAFKNWTNAEGTIVSWDEEFKPAKVDGLNVAGEYTANFGTDENGDKIPDEYQAVVTFAAVNGTVSFDKTYVTLYDAQGNYAEDGTGKLAQNQIAAATPNSGYHFVNWTPETPKQDMEITNKGAAFTANHAINTYAAAVRFLNEDTGEELAPAVTVNNIEHGTYLYGEAHRISIPGYVFTVADTKIVESDHVIVNVYYSADTKGGTPDPDTTPDGTPDKYQVRFEYVADTNGSVTGTTVEYVTRPGNNTTAAVRPQALVDAIANDGYSFMSWTANGNAYVNTDAMRNTYFTEDTVFTAGFAEVVSPILPTPVTPTPPAVTPPTPGTPVPAAPVTPVAPVIPPVVVPVIPTPTPTPNPGPIVNEDDPDQPQGGESTEVQENPTPKGGGSQNEWALINLICAGGTVLLGLFLLLSKLKKEEEEEDEKTSAMRNDDEQSKRYKRRKWLRVASTITAVVSVIAFFLTEDITLPMVLIDKWTLLMAAFLIVQVIFVLFGRKWKELDENETNTETAHS